MYNKERIDGDADRQKGLNSELKRGPKGRKSFVI